MRYGFIGLGNLGGHLAASLLRAGLEVTVHDQNGALAERHLSFGARWAESPKTLAQDWDAAITWLPAPAACESGLTQLLRALKRGTSWIEMSTLGRNELLHLAEIA